MTNKYLRTIYGVDKDGKPGSLQVDVYDILDAYPTKNPALDHLIKKALCPGQRGHKDLLTDLDDIIKSAQRAKELVVNQLACITEVTIDNIPDDIMELLTSQSSVLKAAPIKPTTYAGPTTERPSSFSKLGTIYAFTNVIGALAPARNDDPVAPTKTSEGYDFSFSDRPGSFNNAIIYLVEGVDAGAVERLESEAARCDTVIEYVRHKGDCPKGAIVIHGNNNKMPLDGHQWHYTIDKAIRTLVNDQKGNDTNA